MPAPLVDIAVLQADQDVDALIDALHNKSLQITSEQLARLLHHVEGEVTYQGTPTQCMQLNALDANTSEAELKGNPITVLKPLWKLDRPFQYHEHTHRDVPSCQYTAVDRARLAAVQRFYDAAYRTCVQAISFYRIKDPDTRSTMKDMPWFTCFDSNVTCPQVDKMKSSHRILLHVLNCLASMKMRRMGQDCYHEMIIDGDDGQKVRTCAWVKYCSIEEFVYRCLDREQYAQHWIDAVASSSSVEHCVKILTNCVDSHFPDLEHNRHQFAFRNGCLDINVGVFLPFDEMDCTARSGFSCIQFFDDKFDVSQKETPWRDIKTPHFDTLFTDQGFDQDTLEWMHVMTGRLLFDLGTHDDWQVVLFLKGVAGCGKSTYGNLVRSVYPASMVSSLTSNAETKFGMSAHVNSKLVICGEVTRRFPIDRGQWQSWISGESMNIPRKNLSALDMVIRAPLLQLGNEGMGYADKSDSVGRRSCHMKMENTITESNPKLRELLEGERPLLLFKWGSAYRDRVEQHGAKAFWGTGPAQIVSDQMMKWHDEFQLQVNSLTRFLRTSGKVEKGEYTLQPEFICGLDDLGKAFTAWLRENSMPPETWEDDLYNGVLAKEGLKVQVRTESVRVPGTSKKRVVTKQWVLGLRICDSEDNDTEDEDGDYDGSQA